MSPRPPLRLRVCGLWGVGKRTLEWRLIGCDINLSGQIRKVVPAVRGQGFDLLVAMIAKDDW